MSHGRPEEIIAFNWERFKKWRDHTQTSRTLEMPESVGQVFIPQRVLALSSDPNRVRTVFRENGPNNLGIYICERLEQPITDNSKYEAWKRENAMKQVIVFEGSHLDDVLKSPPGIDYFHMDAQGLVDSGRITFKDKIIIGYSVDVEKGYPHVVHSRSYSDRPELRGRGIGTSFYQRLEYALKELGFEYLTGIIWSRHPRFFQKTRSDYTELPRETQQLLPPYYAKVSIDDPQSRVMVRKL